MALAPLQDKGIVDRAWDAQAKLSERMGRITKGGNYGRVLKMARKPTPEEFQKTAKVTGIGLVVLGAMGFAIYMLMRLIPGLE